MRLSSWGCLGLAILLPLVFIQVNCDVIIERADNRRPYRIYEDQPARFGNALPSDGLVGLVVPVTPITACNVTSPPPRNVTLPKNVYFIALIRRSRPGEPGGECTFQSKVENAQAAGYSGAIVYNYLDDELIPMGGDADVLIPSVFVGKTDGEKMKNQYSFPIEKYFVRITENPPFDINSYLLPFAVVVGICFLIMFGIMVFKCVQDRRRERRHRLPKSSLKKIPTKKFSAEDEARYETCCICLEDYEVGDKLRILPCDHAYHMKCIDPWLLKNKRVCPQCRKKVFASGEIPPSDTESETEDERAPLLARPRATQGGTFTTQNENPFRRAARRIARRSAASAGESSSSGAGAVGARPGAAVTRSTLVRSASPGATSTSSSSTEGGSEYAGHTNQLVTQVYIEQPARMTQSPSPPAEPSPSSHVPSSSPPPSSSHPPQSSPPPQQQEEEGVGVAPPADSNTEGEDKAPTQSDDASNEVISVEIEEDEEFENDGESQDDQVPLLQTNGGSENQDQHPSPDPVV